MYRRLIQKTLEMKTEVLSNAAPDMVRIENNVPVFVYNKKVTKMLHDLDNHLLVLNRKQTEYTEGK